MLIIVVDASFLRFFKKLKLESNYSGTSSVPDIIPIRSSDYHFMFFFFPFRWDNKFSFSSDQSERLKS